MVSVPCPECRLPVEVFHYVGMDCFVNPKVSYALQSVIAATHPSEAAESRAEAVKRQASAKFKRAHKQVLSWMDKAAAAHRRHLAAGTGLTHIMGGSDWSSAVAKAVSSARGNPARRMHGVRPRDEDPADWLDDSSPSGMHLIGRWDYRMLIGVVFKLIILAAMVAGLWMLRTESSQKQPWWVRCAREESLAAMIECPLTILVSHL